MKALKDLKRVQLSDNLWLHEYIDEETYREYEAKGKLQHLVWMLDPRLIVLDQFMRERYGKVTINNWMYRGNRNWSGLRTSDSRYYSEASQHAFGRASDKLFTEKPAKEIIEDIEANYQTIYKDMGLRGLEKRATWVHTDLRNSTTLITFTP